MSMSTHVVGFKSGTEPLFKKMLAAYRACEEARVLPPQAVIDFFNGEPPDEAGVEVDIKKMSGVVTEWCESHGGGSGFELHINKLPKDVTTVRFYNSY